MAHGRQARTIDVTIPKCRGGQDNEDKDRIKMGFVQAAQAGTFPRL